MQSCLSNVHYYVLINGRPRGRIKPSKSTIRQGDLFPHLYVLVMDYFSRILLHLQRQDKIKGVFINDGCNLTHILFADDILIFVEDNEDYISNLKNAIFLIEEASGLNINLSKSSLSPINVDSNRVDEIANSWGIQKKYLSINYLGVPLGGKSSSAHF